MKETLVLTVAAALLSFAGEMAAAAEPQIEWSHNVYESFEKTIQSGKPLVVYFTATNCGYCKQFERGVLNEPEMVAFTERAEFVWADSRDEDDKGNYAQLKRDLNIDKIPAMVVLETSPEGLREEGRIIGYFPLEEFVSHMEEILGPATVQTVAVEPAH